MRAVLLVAAHSLRARWRGWVLIAALVAVGGGAVLASAAGARRTSSAYPRFLQASKASDVAITPAGTGLRGYFRALAQLPGVAGVAPGVGLNLELSAGGPPGVLTEAPVHGRSGTRPTSPRCSPGDCHPKTGPARLRWTSGGRRCCTCMSAACSP